MTTSSILTNPSPRAGYPAQVGRELARAIAAVPAAVLTVFNILAEAEQHSSAARNLFPLAD